MMRFCLILLFQIPFISHAQSLVGNTDYPDSLLSGKEFHYELRNDTLLQKIMIKAADGKQIYFSIIIDKTFVNQEEHVGLQPYTGIATWSGAYCIMAGETEYFSIDEWEYKTSDNTLTITISSQDASRIRIESIGFNDSWMNLKN